MKPDKSTLKKTIKSVTQTIRNGSVAVAARLKPKAPPVATAKAAVKMPEPVPAPEPVKPKSAMKTPAPAPVAAKPPAPAPAPAAKASVPAKATIKAPAPAPVVSKAPVPAPMAVKAPAPAATKTPTPAPVPAKVSVPAPVASKASTPAPVATKAPVPAAVKTPAPAPAVVKTPISIPVEKKAAAESAAQRKSPAKKQELVVPPILLEGDLPSAPTASGPGQRYALGPVPPSETSPTATAGQLPESYGTGKLLFTARDPHWIYARWDLTREQQKTYNSQSADHHLVLRVFRDEAAGEPLAQVHVHPESAYWFVHVAAAGVKYVAELGYFSAIGGWTSIATSGATLTPPDSVSDDSTVHFTTIPLEIPFAQVIEVAKAAVRNTIPLTEVIEQLQAGGFDFPHTPASPNLHSHSSHKWTPEKERALAAIISIDRTRRVWMGSVEITELVRRKLSEETSSIALTQTARLSQPTSPGGALSSVSSPFGGSTEAGKGFWFNLNAELIIYGATEPDAKVTIGGRTIKLRADGTFSYRFTLPDGQYDLPAVAVSADGADRRAAGLTFTRGTRYHGSVGEHPQDPQLKTPDAANVS